MSQLDSFMIGVTMFGDAVFTSVVVIILGFVLFMLKRYRHAVLVVTSVGGGLVIGAALKMLIQRERPPVEGRLIEVANYSFPSIHALGSLVLALCLVLLSWRTKYRYVAIVLAAGYTALIGLSRVYLGVHYWSDVVGGWLVALVWVWLVWRSVRYDAGSEKS